MLKNDKDWSAFYFFLLLLSYKNQQQTFLSDYI